MSTTTTIITPEVASAPARAKAGAEFLDRVEPGWAARIVREDLNIMSCEQCLFGQLFGSFYEAIARFSMGGHQAFGLGFNVNWYDGDGFRVSEAKMDAEATALRLAWLAEIDARLTAQRAAPTATTVASAGPTRRSLSYDDRDDGSSEVMPARRGRRRELVEVGR